MDDNGEIKSDLNVPECDIGKEMSEKFKNDEEVIVSRKAPDNINLARQFKLQVFSLNNSVYIYKFPIPSYFSFFIFTNISHTGFRL